MASEDKLIFLEEPPKEIEIECPICLQVMLNDPHLVSCCGHHFCGTCIKRVKDSNGACPYCKEKEYQTMPNKGHLRIINGLKVNCTNKGCEWKGELKDLPVHLNKGKREGQCQYEEVTCRLNRCEIKKQRQYLEKHEKYECLQRSYQCQHCQYKGTYQFIATEHYPQCIWYPVPCPNKCGFRALPRCNVHRHLTEKCPLQSVKCEFMWAGCHYSLLHKDLQQHNNDSQLKHMSLLAKECRELKKENEKLKQKMTHIHYAVFGDTYPILPVHVPLDGEEIHFYSEPFGHHISVSAGRSVSEELSDEFDDILKDIVVFTVYKEKFHQLKLTNIVVKLDGVTKTLTTGSDEYRESPDDLKSDVFQEFIFALVFTNLEIISVF